MRVFVTTLFLLLIMTMIADNVSARGRGARGGGCSGGSCGGGSSSMMMHGGSSGMRASAPMFVSAPMFAPAPAPMFAPAPAPMFAPAPAPTPMFRTSLVWDAARQQWVAGNGGGVPVSSGTPVLSREMEEEIINRAVAQLVDKCKDRVVQNATARLLHAIQEDGDVFAPSNAVSNALSNQVPIRFQD